MTAPTFVIGEAAPLPPASWPAREERFAQHSTDSIRLDFFRRACSFAGEGATIEQLMVQAEMLMTWAGADPLRKQAIEALEAALVSRRHYQPIFAENVIMAATPLVSWLNGSRSPTKPIAAPAIDEFIRVVRGWQCARIARGKQIADLWVLLCVDPDGNESVVWDWRDPPVGADETAIAHLRELAARTAARTSQSFRLVKFSSADCDSENFPGGGRHDG